jgi:hypothetical protein
LGGFLAAVVFRVTNTREYVKTAAVTKATIKKQRGEYEPVNTSEETEGEY